MRLEQITPETIKVVSNRELVALHFRIHQLWAQRKYKKMNVKLLKEKHAIIISEMKNRGLIHKEHVMKRMMSKLETYLEGLD